MQMPRHVLGRRQLHFPHRGPDALVPASLVQPKAVAAFKSKRPVDIGLVEGKRDLASRARYNFPES